MWDFFLVEVGNSQCFSDHFQMFNINKKIIIDLINILINNNWSIIINMSSFDSKYTFNDSAAGLMTKDFCESYK